MVETAAYRRLLVRLQLEHHLFTYLLPSSIMVSARGFDPRYDCSIQSWAANKQMSYSIMNSSFSCIK